MPSAFLVRLRPTGPWRIGPDSGDRDRVDRILHSDAVFAAVTSAMSRLGFLEEWLDATARAAAPAVRFSSCFPFHAETLYVVPPRHVWPPAASAKVRWKGAKFVPLKVVETLLNGQSLKEDTWNVDGASECLMPSSAPQGATVFRTAVRSNAAVDRAGEAVAPHSTACLEFAPNSGLWCVAVFADDAAREEWGDRVRGAFKLLADSGIGGGRSRGWGRSEKPEIRHGELSRLLLDSVMNEGESGHWLLSLYHPSESDSVDWSRGNYALTTRTGRAESESGWGVEKRATKMVSEGSVLVAASELNGTAPDVAPEGFEHPVYRAGFAISIPVPLKPVAKASSPAATEGGLQAARDFRPAAEESETVTLEPQQSEAQESHQEDDSAAEATRELKSASLEEPDAPFQGEESTASESSQAETTEPTESESAS